MSHKTSVNLLGIIVVLKPSLKICKYYILKLCLELTTMN
jgi:hypothetical protein